MEYSVTLEHGTDGTTIAWVEELPGLAVRGPSRDDVLVRLPGAIEEFARWAGLDAESVEVRVTSEVSSEIPADEDTEVLLDADRRPLTGKQWEEVASLLERSRTELEGIVDDADREVLRHIAFVELMYAAWTFDLDSSDGLREFLAWTRSVSAARMRELAEHGSDDLTYAHWSGAPRPEPWTARKAARRLVWHELLHLRALRR